MNPKLQLFDQSSYPPCIRQFILAALEANRVWNNSLNYQTNSPLGGGFLFCKWTIGNSSSNPNVSCTSVQYMREVFDHLLAIMGLRGCLSLGWIREVVEVGNYQCEGNLSWRVYTREKIAKVCLINQSISERKLICGLFEDRGKLGTFELLYLWNRVDVDNFLVKMYHCGICEYMLCLVLYIVL